jgi:hypothetical protein
MATKTEQYPIRPEAVIAVVEHLAEMGHFARRLRVTIFDLWVLAQVWSPIEVTRRELRATLGAAGLVAGGRATKPTIW